MNNHECYNHECYNCAFLEDELADYDNKFDNLLAELKLERNMMSIAKDEIFKLQEEINLLVNEKHDLKLAIKRHEEDDSGPTGNYV